MAHLSRVLYNDGRFAVRFKESVHFGEFWIYWSYTLGILRQKLEVLIVIHLKIKRLKRNEYDFFTGFILL